VANFLKTIFVKFIESGRAGRYCELDLGIGKLIAFPNGTLNFTDKEENIGQNDERMNARPDRIETAPVPNTNSISCKLESIVDLQSVRTPFTALGTKKSVYGGRNKTVFNWYAN